MFKKQIPSKNIPKKFGSTDITPYWEVIKNIINDADMILEVLDARMPDLSRNKELEEVIKKFNKPIVLILNKADLVSNNQLRLSLNRLKKEYHTFIISSTNFIGTKRLREWLIAQSKNKENFRIGVLGYPNTGKSSVINIIAKRKKAKVSSRAGTTRGQQWINVADKIRIIDSPGIIPIKQEDEVRYALIASRNVEKIKNLEIVAHEIIKLFLIKDNLNKLYGIQIANDENNPDKIIELIGRKKGFIKKGGLIETSRVAIQIIKDWQIGKLRL